MKEEAREEREVFAVCRTVRYPREFTGGRIAYKEKSRID
jgi:hypothetical protein